MQGEIKENLKTSTLEGLKSVIKTADLNPRLHSERDYPFILTIIVRVAVVLWRK